MLAFVIKKLYKIDEKLARMCILNESNDFLRNIGLMVICWTKTAFSVAILEYRTFCRVKMILIRIFM